MLYTLLDGSVESGKNKKKAKLLNERRVIFQGEKYIF